MDKPLTPKYFGNADYQHYMKYMTLPLKNLEKINISLGIYY